MEKIKVAIIGGGNMGKAIIQELITQGHSPSNIFLVEISQERRKELEHRYNIISSYAIESTIKDFKAIIIAVKPQNIDEVIDRLSEHITEKNFIISIAAGISTTYIERKLNKNIPIVRTMPNIAAYIGKAAVAMCGNRFVSDFQIKMAKQIMQSIGTIIEVDEKHLDAITGLSGSGPAFVFLLIDALADGGVLTGLPRDIAFQLALETVFGAASFLKETHTHPSVAKEMVASPGGTTIEGILQLEMSGFRGLVMNAVKLAAEKSSKL